MLGQAKLIHTAFERHTVDQQFRIIIPPIDMDEKPQFINCVRFVQLFIPATPEIMVVTNMLPEAIAMSRGYTLPVVPPAVPVKFHLNLDQFVTAGADEGFGEVSSLIEYWKVS